MKKRIQIWLGISIPLLLMTFLMNWNNHPHVLRFLKSGTFFFIIAAAALLIRRFFLKESWAFWRTAGLVLVAQTAAVLLMPSIPTVRMAAVSALILIGAVMFYFLLAFLSDPLEEAAAGSKVLKKIPSSVRWGVLMAAGLTASCILWFGQRAHPSSLPLQSLRLTLAISLSFLFCGLIPFIRSTVLRLRGEFFRTLLLLLGTLWILVKWNEYAQLGGGIASILMAWAHFLLTAAVAVGWEPLKENRGRWRAWVLGLAGLFWVVSAYTNGFKGAWLVQILGLALLWAWDPHLRNRPRETALALLGLLLYLLSPRGVNNLMPSVAFALAAVSLLRLHVFKLPLAFLRGLVVFLAVLYLHTVPLGFLELSSGWWSDRAGFCWVFSLIFASLLSLYWEALREKGSDARKQVQGAALALAVAGFLGTSLKGLFQVLILGLAWRYAEPVAERVGRLWKKWAGPEEKGPELPIRPMTIEEAEAAEIDQVKPRKVFVPPVWMKDKRVQFGGLALIALLAVGWGIRWGYRHSVVTVKSFTPSGVLHNRNVALRVEFSDPVAAAGDLSTAIQVKPPLTGTARLDQGKALVFIPSTPLKPATTYKARFSSKPLKSGAKWSLQSSAETSFSSEPFRATGCNLYFTYDPIWGNEKELVAELDFNYPVAPDVLKSHLSVKRDGQSLAFKLEQASLPQKFYVRVDAPARTVAPQNLELTVSKDLSCVECGAPLGQAAVWNQPVPAKPEFAVEEVRLHHRPGSSLLSILFSQAVSADQVRAALSVDPPLPIKVDTEHRYAVLTADFKPNITYKITVKKGMRGDSGDVLKNKYERSISLKDAPPFVRFADPGRLVPLKGPGIVAIQTMNLDNFKVNVMKVFKNNLVSFLKNRSTYYRNYAESEDGEEYGYETEYGSSYGLGTDVWSGQVTVTGGQLNEAVENSLTLKNWQKAPWKGLFVVDVEGPSGGGSDSRWFLATDLGILAKRAGDDLWVQVLSLSGVKPLSGVSLKLVSQNNQVMQAVQTGSDGKAWFKNWKVNPYKFEPLLLLAENGDDWSFLRLDRSALDASRFDTGGDPFKNEGWDGFLTSDRGLYRPGELVNLTALVRRADLETPEKLPVRLKVYDPQGNEIHRQDVTLDSDGLKVFHLRLPEGAATGQMAANLSLDNNVHLASTNFKVEEFIPHKIKVEVSGKKTAEKGKISYEVSAHHLFGPPAPKLKVRSNVRLVPQEFRPKDWESYRFVDDSRQFGGETLDPADGETDADGKVTVELSVPDSIAPPSMLKAVVYAECFDTGGRPVGANASVDVHRYPLYLGIKSVKGREMVPGKPVTLRYLAVTPDGKLTRAPSQLLILKRRVWYSIFRRYGWSSDRGFQTGYYDEKVGGRELSVDGKGEYIFTPDKPGEYTVFLGTDEGPRTSLSLVAEGPGAHAAAETASPTGLDVPENLSLSLDKKKYLPGQSPRLEVKAPFAGTLVVSVEREKVFMSRTVPVKAGLNLVSLPSVASDWAPNVYVTAVLARPPRETLRMLPRMSFGVLPLTLEAGDRRIRTDFKTPKTVESRGGIPVTLDTGTPGAQVVLAAVDEGVLQIIGFGTPDPFKWFYRKRSLTTETWSLFTDVLPELSRRQAVGGDEAEAYMDGAKSKASRHLNPVSAKRVVTYAKFAGPLKADGNGRVVHRFEAKGFHGQVRVMALVAKQKRFGGGATEVRVADPLVMEPSFPRFLAPGDTFDVPLMLSNQKDNKMPLSVSWDAKGPVKPDGISALKTVLEPKGQTQVAFHGEALSDAGTAHLKVKAVSSDGRVYDDETEIAVRPPNPLTTDVSYGEINPAGKAVLQVPSGFITFGQKIRFSVSASSLLPFLGSLDYLIGYPYGCTEQVVSKGFPLLYLKDMGLLTGRFEDRARAVEFYVQEAVDKVQAFQREDGTFGYWPGDTEPNEYLSNYASHFLLEAFRLGYDVKLQTLSRIRKRIGAIRVRGEGGRLDRRKENVEVQDSTYILYLRALAGTPDAESMNAIREQGRKDFLLSLAYSASGDLESARRVLPVKVLPSGLERRLSGDWFSPLQYHAQYLLALAAADPRSPDIPILIKEYGKNIRQGGHFGSTHDNAWSLMALAKAVSERGKLDPLSAEWNVEGGAAQGLSGETAVMKDRTLSGKKVTLRNTGNRPVYYHLMAEGTRLAAKKESVSNGLSIAREYRDEKGNPVNLGSVTQGEIVVVTLRLKAVRPLDNVVIVDLLPAGFEVDNPRLKSRGRMEFDCECSLETAYRDFRDDRVLLFTRAFEGEETFSYSVRAVTPGKYAVPSLLAEAMYDPDVYARSGGGETLVVAPFKP